MLKRKIEKVITNCLDYKSEVLLSWADGLKDATSRNLDKQRSVFEGADRFHALLQEMPLGEPATGGVWRVEAALKTIKCLLNRHRGELREWHGCWEPVDAPLPEKHEKPAMWHNQFLPPHAEDPGAISTVLCKPASGGGHSVRVAIVIGLADLFFDYGEAHSTAELYQLWKQLRIFAHQRAKALASGRSYCYWRGRLYPRAIRH